MTVWVQLAPRARCLATIVSHVALTLSFAACDGPADEDTNEDSTGVATTDGQGESTTTSTSGPGTTGVVPETEGTSSVTSAGTETGPTTTSSGDTSGSETEGSSGSTGGGDGLRFCREASDEARCLAGDLTDQEGAGSDCVWLPAVEFDVADNACALTTTDRGYCRGRNGNDDGCTQGDAVCGLDDVHVSFTELRAGTFELVFGLACRANEVGEACDDLLHGPEQPGNPEFHVCYCACDYYERVMGEL